MKSIDEVDKVAIMGCITKVTNFNRKNSIRRQSIFSAVSSHSGNGGRAESFNKLPSNLIIGSSPKYNIEKNLASFDASIPRDTIK